MTPHIFSDDEVRALMAACAGLSPIGGLRGVFDYGRAASTSSVRYAFKWLRRQLKWRARGDHPALRIHDLRHSFICHRLERWHAQGLDVDRNILALSTYVGHAKVTDTYWYVTATPELLDIAAKRFASQAGGDS